MSEELEVLKNVIERLDKINISYMITGSIATNFYAIPRMTRDIDIVIEIELPQINNFLDVFKDDFYIDKEMINQAIVNKKMFNIIHNTYVIKIDFIIRKDSEYRMLEFKRKVPINVEGKKMFIVSAEDLVLSKLLWAKDSLSEIQLKDAKNIIEGVNNIDIQYIEQWIKTFKLEKIYNKLIS
jgi:hypothetical protein